jgi:hypothetical protein
MGALRALRLASQHVREEVQGLRTDAARWDTISAALLDEAERILMDVDQRLGDLERAMSPARRGQ